MTVTYDLTSDIGKVRLLISDTSLTSPYFQDEEIQVFLSLYPGSLRLPAAQTLESWAAAYSANADSERIGDYSYTQKTVTSMLALAEKLRNDENTQPVIDWASFDMTHFGEIEGVDHIDGWFPVNGGY